MTRPSTRPLISCLRMSIVVGFVVLFSYLCVEGAFILFVGPSASQVFVNVVEIQQDRKALATAKLKWTSQHISHYKITAINLNFAPADLFSCRLENTLTVKDGKVIDALIPREECRDVYPQFTVEGMFDLATKSLTDARPLAMKVRVEFNPTFGFVSLYSDEFYSGGLFAPARDQLRTIKLYNLVVLADP